VSRKEMMKTLDIVTKTRKREESIDNNSPLTKTSVSGWTVGGSGVSSKVYLTSGPGAQLRQR
jgi:hypothetical protein